MPLPSPLRALAVLGVSASFLAACDPANDGEAARTLDSPDQVEAAIDLAAYLPPPVDSVTITVRGCPAGNQPVNLVVDVEPKSAHVVRGDRFKWGIEVPNGPVRVRINHRDGTWPFADTVFGDTITDVNRQRLDAGAATQAAAGDRSRYDIWIRCRGVQVTIDPEFVIRDPGHRNIGT